MYDRRQRLIEVFEDTQKFYTEVPALASALAASRNGTTTLVNGAFPELDPGENAVSFSGWSRVEIIPRWWTI